MPHTNCNGGVWLLQIASMKDIEKERAKRRRYYANHREQVKKHQKEHRKETVEERRAWGKAYRKANAEKIRIGKKKYNDEHREQLSARNKIWKKNNPDKIKKRAAIWRIKYKARNDRNRRERIIKSYGMSVADYEAMLAAQKGLCAICKDAGAYRICIDHDHLTGKVRGLLCDNCNHGLGVFRDNIDLLYEAISYLKLCK